MYFQMRIFLMLYTLQVAGISVSENNESRRTVPSWFQHRTTGICRVCRARIATIIACSVSSMAKAKNKVKQYEHTCTLVN